MMKAETITVYNNLISAVVKLCDLQGKKGKTNYNGILLSLRLPFSN